MKYKLDNRHIVLIDTKCEWKFVIPYYKRMMKHCVIVFNVCKNFGTINNPDFEYSGHCSFNYIDGKNKIIAINISCGSRDSLLNKSLDVLLKDLKHFETLNLEHLFKKSYNTNYISSKEKQIQHLQSEITNFKKKNNN